MTKELTREQIDRLHEIKSELKELVQEAFDLVRGTHEEERAKGYWYASIIVALDRDHDFLTRSGQTLSETINSLEG